MDQQQVSCCWILAKLHGFQFLCTTGNRRGSFTRSTLLFGQLQSFSPNNSVGEVADYWSTDYCITWEWELTLSKVAAVWYRIKEQLPQYNLRLQLLSCLSHKLCYLTCNSTLVSNANRLWPINSVHLQKDGTDTFDPKTRRIFRSWTNLTSQIFWNMCVSRSSFLISYHDVLSPYIKYNSRKGCCSRCSVNKPVVKWFVQKCTKRNTQKLHPRLS